MAKPLNKQNKVTRLMKSPMRALAKARDCYVNSMIMCSGQYGDGLGPLNGSHGLPRSYSSASSTSRSGHDDFRELVRASSTTMLRTKGVVNHDGVKRSQSLGIGRIDEDKLCEFDGDFVEVRVPRSRSYAVAKRTMI